MIPLDQTVPDQTAGVAADLTAAEFADHPADRFLAAHRAALRATSVVLRVRTPRRTGRQSAWQLVAQVAPELAEWAGFFLASQAKRDVVEAGARAVVTEREADDLLRDAQRFCQVVQAWYARQAAPTRVEHAPAGWRP